MTYKLDSWNDDLAAAEHSLKVYKDILSRISIVERTYKSSDQNVGFSKDGPDFEKAILGRVSQSKILLVLCPICSNFLRIALPLPLGKMLSIKNVTLITGRCSAVCKYCLSIIIYF